MVFYRYPDRPLPSLAGQTLLSLEGPVLESAEQLVLLDGTWRYAAKMEHSLQGVYVKRRLPDAFVTAYPRRQDQPRGLASIEALYAAYVILGWPAESLLDRYPWADRFLDLNRELL